MMKPTILLAPLFFRKAAVYEFPGSIEYALGQLSLAVKGPVFHNPLQQCIVGKVSETRVVLRRYRPLWSNSFIPIFRGAFLTRNGKTVLDGEYSIFKFAKIFMSIWLTAVMIMFVIFSITTILGAHRDDIFMYLGVPAAMVFFGVLLINLGWAIGKSDIDYIEATIKETINKMNEPGHR